MRRGERAEADVRQRVAVDDEERVDAENGERLTRSARAAEDDGLLPRIADARRQIAAVADDRRERVGTMVEVEHEVGDAVVPPATR